MNPLEEELVDAPEVREGAYGTRVVAVEPGGAEFIPLEERHGRPHQLFWTWTSPNFEFATVFVGVIAVAFFGLNLAQAIAAIVLGTLLGSLTHGVLSARGPAFGVPQMVLSRISFGYRGNILPAGLNAAVAGIGWFAVNSVSGAFALSSLTHWSDKLCLVIIVAIQMVVAFFGHNLVHAFERYAFPFLATVFVIASVIVLSKAQPGAVHASGGIGGFLLTVGATFGYAAGWNPYASDYTRYFPPHTSRRATGLWAGAGIAISCILLETVGAAAATIPGANWDNPTTAFTHDLPSRRRRPHPAGDRHRCHRGQRAEHLLRSAQLHHLGHQAPGAGQPRGRRRGLRRRRLPGRAERAEGCRLEVRELPARHRLLDRAVAGRLPDRPAAAPRAPRR